LFDECKRIVGINYHGSVSNEEIKKILKSKHIYAYPNIWQETSCISLMEAMSAGLVCVHPNYGALPETAANWTHMYQWDENMSQHANRFYSVLRASIEEIVGLTDEQYNNKIMTQKSYADIFYNWSTRISQWEAMLRSLENESTEMPKEHFIYRTN
jgi:glycosyltransferase involved in cell wall biosynthesis